LQDNVTCNMYLAHINDTVSRYIFLGALTPVLGRNSCNTLYIYIIDILHSINMYLQTKGDIDT